MVDFSGGNSFRAMGRPTVCMIFDGESNGIAYNVRRCRRIPEAEEFSTKCLTKISELKTFEAKMILNVFSVRIIEFRIEKVSRCVVSNGL